ncbi:hypothetical protein ACFQJD_07025 [Haloplanus sp. GCM10025708]|uniref:hypothetical protein n=1 Tax=Haloferacaceae TaxID=1644056 RepID=UPI00360F885E
MTGRLRRRGFLGVVAAAALAGCSDALDDEPTRLDGAELTALADSETPSVPKSVPVSIAPAYLDRSERRARDLLDVVPDPLEPRHVPNEAIRDDISRARERAREALDRAASAATPFERMAALRSARADAANASGAWRAVDEAYERADVVNAAPALAEDVHAFRDQLTYVGGDAVDAVLVYAPVERRVRSAANDVSRLTNGEFARPENALTVGEASERLERARASLDDAHHLAERHAESVASARDLGDRLSRATADLESAVDAEYRTLPEESAEGSAYVDRDVGDTPAAWVLQQAYGDLDWMREEVAERRSAGYLADAVLAAHEALVQRRAFGRLRERVASGENFAVSSVADVRTMRADAVSAVESTRSAPPRTLNRTAVHDPAQQLGFVDDQLSRVGDDPTAAQVGHEAADYVRVEATASSIPPASERVVETLRAGE